MIQARACRICTVVGTPGVGKSRLTRELLLSLKDVAVLEGRCLPYGNGITYWPIIEAVKPLETRLSSLGLDAKVEAIVNKLLAGATAASTDEIAWAFRRLVEAVAADMPVVLVFDDIQWGEEAFLDLVEHLALTSREAPVLLLCLARTELLEKRPRWVADLHLEPLAANETEQLIEQCLEGAQVDAAARERIRASAGGNPFFIEEMVAMVQTADGDGVLATPTIQALLAARIDQLEARERQVFIAAAVEGEVFHRGAIQALLSDEPNVTSRLNALVRKDLVAPHPAQLPGEGGFKFRHLLIRDAAYDSTPKAIRAELHDHFSTWLDGAMSGRLPELDAIVGYHLEQAVRFRATLGPLDDHGRDMALRAGWLLGSAGERALVRGDIAAAVSLMERALGLLPADDPDRLRLLPRLGRAARIGGHFGRALAILDEAIVKAVAADNPSVEHRARIGRARIRHQTATVEGFAELVAEVETAIPLFKRLGDDAGLAEAWHAMAEVEGTRCRYGAARTALEHALFHARRVGDEDLVIESECWYGGGSLRWGATAATEMARYAREQLTERAGIPRLETPLMCTAAFAEALQGHIDEARALYAQGQALIPPALYESIGGASLVAATSKC